MLHITVFTAYLILRVWCLTCGYNNSAQNALRACTSDAQCWYLLGGAYIMRGSYLAGLKALQQCQTLNPTHMDCQYKIGSVFRILNQYTDAIDMFETLLTQDPQYLPGMF